MTGGTLDTLKALFFGQLKKGEELDCPCCGRFTKIYKRKIHTGIALQLIELYRLGGAVGYVHTSQLIGPGLSGIGDFSKAKYWHLIERMPVDLDEAVTITALPRAVTSGEKKSSGYWKLTHGGVSFVRGLCTIREHVIVYDDRVLEFEGKEVTIYNCLGDKFDYATLMAEPLALGDVRFQTGGTGTATSVNGIPL